MIDTYERLVSREQKILRAEHRENHPRENMMMEDLMIADVRMAIPMPIPEDHIHRRAHRHIQSART